MAGNIKGIIVEIGGDTSGLQKSLKEVNSTISSLSKELGGINSLLKVDPKNLELLGQKQTVLNQAIEQTQNKLQQLQKIKEEADKKMSEGTQINEENYRALQREITKTQTKLSDLKNASSNWTQVGNNLVSLGKDLDNISEKIGSLGSKLTKTVTAPIVAIAAAGITYDAQIEKYETAFKTFLGSAEAASVAINNLKEDAKKTPFDTTSIVKANQMLISTGVSAEDARQDILALGEAVIATGGGNDELVRMASNLQQIRNAGKATAMDIRQFAYAGIDVYGILADEMGKTTEEIKDMEISYKDLTKALKKASSQGGKYFGSIENSSKTLTGQISALKSEFQEMLGNLTKSLMPVAKSIVSTIRDVVSQFDRLSDSEKTNIVKIGLLVAAAGPLLQLGSSAINIIGGVSKGIGTFTQAISLAQNGIGTTTGAAATLAKVMQGLSSPIGLAAIGITSAVSIIVAAMQDAQKETVSAFETMQKSATDYMTGIEQAQGYLSSFNEQLFVTSEEQQQLATQMQEVQEGITSICKTATEERRNYTAEEIIQLDEYFTKLRELNQREIEIQQQISQAITQQASTNAQVFQGSLVEYQKQSEQWIKTAAAQKDKTIDLINNQTIEEVALLNTRYNTEESRQTEEYKNEYQRIIEQKDKKIEEANDEVAKIYKVYADGYLERTKQNDGFYNHLQEFKEKQEKLQEAHNKKIKQIQNDELWYVTNKYQALKDENDIYAFHQRENWNEMYKNMSEEQQKELGIWMAMVSQTELYGGKIDDETKELVDSVITSYEALPPETKKVMIDTMQGMLNAMEEKEPVLYAKATSIAENIASRLREALDVNSPSRVTRKIFQYVMEGAELGLEDEENKIYRQVDDIANKLKEKFSSIMPNMSQIKQSVMDNTQTIFTTPNIVFNVQKMDEANLDTAFNYVNKRLGSQY